MSIAEAALQNVVDGSAKVLGGRRSLAEFRARVQILKIEPIQNFALHEAVQIRHIANHAGGFIHSSAHGDLEPVIVSVPIRVIAFAIGERVLRIGHSVAVQTVRGRKHIAAGQVRLHASPFMTHPSCSPKKSTKRSGVSYTRTRCSCAAFSLVARRCQMAIARFSVVGILVENSGTSLFRKRWSMASRTSRVRISFNCRRSTTKPERGSTSPLTVTSRV